MLPKDTGKRARETEKRESRADACMRAIVENFIMSLNKGSGARADKEIKERSDALLRVHGRRRRQQRAPYSCMCEREILVPLTLYAGMQRDFQTRDDNTR